MQFLSQENAAVFEMIKINSLTVRSMILFVGELHFVVALEGGSLAQVGAEEPLE